MARCSKEIKVSLSVAARAPQPGDQLDNRTVIAVRPYSGKYPQWFRWFVTVSSPRTASGRIEYAL